MTPWADLVKRLAEGLSVWGPTTGVNVSAAHRHRFHADSPAGRGEWLPLTGRNGDAWSIGDERPLSYIRLHEIEPVALLIVPRNDGRFDAIIGERSWTVDAGTALVALLLHGVTVEVACRACEGSSVQWMLTRSTAADFAIGEEGWHMVPVFLHGRQGGGDVQHLCWRPCPACTIDGTPTGREVVDVSRVVLDAAPRTESSERTWADRYAAEVTCSQLNFDKGVDAFVRESGDEWRIEWPTPGDPKARETLAVLGDRLQAEGDERGAVLAAWLRGECPTCPSSSDLEAMADTSTSSLADTFDDLVAATRCHACHGHGTILGAHADLVERLVVEACERLELARLQPLGAQYDVCSLAGETAADFRERLRRRLGVPSRGREPSD